MDFSLKPIRDARGVVTLLIPEARDITARKEAETIRQALEVQLTQAQKMEAIGQVAGGVAHDFNNLLTVINGYSEVLLATPAIAGDDRVMVQGIANAGAQAATLTRQLLMFTRRQVVEPQLLDLNTVVTDNERLLRRLIGEDIRLETRLDPAGAQVRADVGHVGQVLLNLAVNARDAMPAGGTITIRTEQAEVEEGGLDSAAGTAVPGRHVVLVVKDTGHGMPAEIMGQIFAPFFTTKGPEIGTGMGLATVRTIAEQSGGFVVVSSAPGRGSEFRFYLPAQEPPRRDRGRSPRHRAGIGSRGDDPAGGGRRRGAGVDASTAPGQGYHVLEASGGEMALKRGRGPAGRIDLLLTDVVMPDIGGRVLAERLCRLLPGLKVLFMSGYTDDAVVRHGVQEAEVAFLQKPFSIEAFNAKVRQVLDSGEASARGQTGAPRGAPRR